MSQNYISTPATNGVESFISGGGQSSVIKRSSGLSNPLPSSTPTQGFLQSSPAKRDSIHNASLENRRFTQKAQQAQQLTASVPQSAFALAGNRVMKPPIRPQEEGRANPSIIVHTTGGNGRDFQLALNATQPAEEYYQMARAAARQAESSGIISPPNNGGHRDSTNQFKTMMNGGDPNKKVGQDLHQHSNSTGFRGSELQPSNFDSDIPKQFQSASHQSSIVQVKLPQIRNAGDFRSPPQRMSHQAEKDLLASESQRRLQESAIITQGKGSNYSDQQQQAMAFSDASFIKKALSQAKKTSPLEDQLVRNTRFFNSASNHPNNLNAVLWGQLSGQSPPMPVTQKQDTLENPRDSKKAKIRPGPNQPPPSSNGITVKKQYNHQFSNLKTRQQAKQTTNTQGNNFAVGEFNQVLDLTAGPPLVLVNKMNTPLNQVPLKPQVQRQPSNLKIDAQRPKGTAHQDSQKSYILSENGTINSQQTPFMVKEHGYMQANIVGVMPESSPSKLGYYNQTPNPYMQNDRGGPIQISSIQDYLSPKLLYRKRKRDTYKAVFPKDQIQNNVPTAQISLGKNHFLVAKETTSNKGTIASLHSMVNQLISKNQGSQNPGFILALKNLQNTVNKDPHMAGEALEAIQRAMAAEKYFLPTLGGVGLARSLSQEIFIAEASQSQAQATANGIKESSSQENYLNQLAAVDQMHLQQQQITLNSYKNQLQAAKGRVLNATELYELAKQIKYKQYQQAQQNQTSARKNGIPIASPRGMTSHSPNKEAMTMEERQNMMMDALNVVKLTQKRTVDQILAGSGDTTHLQESPEMTKVFGINSKSDLNNFESSKKDITSMFKGINPYPGQEFIQMQDEEYFRRQQEIFGTYGHHEIQSFNPRDNRDTSRNGKQRLKQTKPDDNFGMQGLTSALSITDSKIKMISSIESISNVIPHKQPGAPQKFYIMNSAAWTNQGYQTLEGRNHYIGKFIDNSQEDLSQPMALGFPMTIIGEQVLQQMPHQIPDQQYQQQQQQQNGNQYIKEFLKNRKQRMSQKQQQLAKISRVSDLEKLLYQQPGFEDVAPINPNPGGGGRKAAVMQQQSAPQKRRPEPQITDNDNEALSEHPINKTIKMMNILNQLLFKGLKEFNPVQQEILNRCTRYFNFQIPKQFRHEMQTLSKQKDFLSLVREKMYTLFIQHVIRTNGISDAVLAQNQAQGTYKYFISGGNNHMLVKQVFKTRSWWNQGEKDTLDECNFVWSQWIKERHINCLKPYEKPDMAQANRQDPVEQESNPPPSIRIYNKIQGNQCLSDKKHLFFNMRELYKERGQDVFSVMPITFVINDGLNDHEFDKFESVFRNIEDQIKRYPAMQAQFEANLNSQEDGSSPLSPPKLMNNVWIVKPGEDTNRGSGIIVTKDFNEIKNLVRDKSSRVNKTAIIQKYIENPLLINKRKFDIRCYGLLTSINGHMLGFFYQDGYLRTSCKEFSVQNLSNRYIHLTNDAIQKHSEDYGKFENANKLSYQDFDRYFAEFPLQDYDLRFQRDFLPQIRAMVRDTYQAAEKKIDPYRRTNTFEIFGYDFMIDDECKLKLIEVNTNPSLEVCCPLLARIIPSMLDSVFRIAIDPIFQQPPNRRQYSGTEAMNDLKMELVFESPYPDSKDKRPVEPANVEVREHHEIIERAEEEEEEDMDDGDQTPLVRQVSADHL